MAIWIELHCDVLGDAVDSCGRSRCAGKNGDQLGAMAAKASTVQVLIRDLAKYATANGWLVSRGRYTCPACLTMVKGMK